MRTLKLSFKNHLLNLLPQLFVLLIFIALVISTIDFENIKDDRAILGIFFAFAIMMSIPTIYVHYGYYLENKGANFLVYPNKIVNANTGLTIQSEEIQKIIIHHSNKNSYRTMPWKEYSYCEVKLKNGETIILTSLLKKNIGDFLKENLNGVLFELDDSFFASFI